MRGLLQKLIHPGTALHAFIIAAAYMVLASLWIFLSSYLGPTGVEDVQALRQFETIKGLAFITLTGMLLYLLLLRMEKFRDPVQVEALPQLKGGMGRQALILGALFLMVPLIGALVVWLEAPRLKQHAFEELGSIAQLKARQIDSWINERSSDGSTLANDANFIGPVSRMIMDDDAVARDQLRQRLEIFRAAYNYDAISIIDVHGESVLHISADNTSESSHGLSSYRHRSADAEQGGPAKSVIKSTESATALQNRYLHYYLYEDHLHIDFSFPLGATSVDSEPLATLIFHLNSRNFLYPYITAWPTASSSGESLLAMQAADKVIFITPFRHAGSSPEGMEYELAAPTLPAAVALRKGARGIVEGMDYRSEPVLAAYHPLASTDWQLIAKLDRDEVMAPLYHLVFWVGLITLVAATLISLLFIWLWRQQQRLHRLSIEAERHQADNLLRLFYDMPFIGIATTSPQSKRWLRFNDRLCDILGYSRRELAEMDWVELTHPDDLDTDVTEFERVMRNESDGYNMDKRFIRKDGSILHAYIDVKCVRTAQGEVDYFVAMVQDINERKLGERALEHARQRAQGYLDIAGVMMLALDTGGRITMVNRKACEILGYAEGELLGQNWIDRCVPEDDRDTLKQVCERIMRGEIASAEYVENIVISRDGSERLIAWHNALLHDENGLISGVLSSGEDITETRAAQQQLAASRNRLHTLVQTIPDLVWLKDAEGVYLACNPRFERFFGASEAEIVGKTDYDFVDREMADFFSEHDRRAMAAGKPSINEETLTFAVDGYQGRFETTKTPMFDDQGQLIGVLGIAHDITQQQQTIARIAQLSKLYNSLSQTNQAIVRSKTEQEMFEQVCRSAVEFAGFRMAWIGLLEVASQKVIPTVCYGEGSDYLDKIELSYDAASPNGNGPVGTAVRQQQPCWCQDFLNEESTRPWHEQAKKAGIAAAAALPLRRNGEVIGCFTLYSDECNAFDQAVQDLLVEMAVDISFALDNFDREDIRRKAEQRLALVIEGSSDAPWDWDLLTDQLYYSPQWWRMLGYQVDELPGDSALWQRLAHADDIQQVEQTLQRIQQPGHDRDAVECRFRHKDGHYVPTLIRGIVSRDASARPVRLTGTVLDLTERKRTEDQLREQLDELNRWFTATIGREERILELKQEVNVLLQQHRQAPRYPSAVEDKLANDRR